MTTGQRITLARIQAGLSVEDLAAALNKNRATVYRYESSDIDIPLSIISKVAEVCHVDPGFLVNWEPSEHQMPNANEALIQLQKKLDSEHEAVELFSDLSPEEIQRVRDFVAGLKASRKA